MCIAAWVWQSHPVYQLLLLLNRDEYHDRPTQPLHWWEDKGKGILGGRDELAGGTWLGSTKDGRLAFLTNFREPCSFAAARSRGELPVRFLESTKSPYEFAEEIAHEANLYNGFNMIMVDICSKVMVYMSNRPKGDKFSIQIVPAGVHVLTNANLDTPWPKAQKLTMNFRELLLQSGQKEICAEEILQQLMLDHVKAERHELPNTGCNIEWEHELSSVFIATDTEKGRYGTRSMSCISIKTTGELRFYERYLENSLWNEHAIELKIEKVQEV